ncbi:winged helix-turn-helix transcriptional regulator [Flavihumibacter petaseus]|uniref:Putative HxlR family transcriptional regulator n=1 Tax=Flavihumibacter petaseus NBRC 106054 TaxID=1220578 RepID=A0A0E9N3G0_9BACT|nr:helix-turn-helix domain-containing protein [Flavihumibacter petaseus]GAO44507.1 putative HxlR family transcriptional regulator [Flavihumibacter petaseus NBRC 106054]
MTAIKPSSTRQENRQTAIAACPVSFVMDKIGGNWKPVILFQMMSGAKRYSEIKKAIPTITEKVLIQHLKQLQDDGLVLRKALDVVPPHVEYRLSKSGQALTPVLNAMAAWAFEHREFGGRKASR